MKLKTFILFSLALFLFSCKQEQKLEYEIHEKKNKGPIEVEAKLAKKSCSILDKQYLFLSIRSPIEYSIKTPMLRQRLEDFRLVPWRPDSETIDENGVVTIEKRIAMEFLESGPQVIPPIAIKYSSGSGQNMIAGELKLPKILFEVTPIDDTQLLNEELSPTADLIRQPKFSLATIIIWWIGLLVVCIVLITIIVIATKKKKQVVQRALPAHLLAYKELEELIKLRGEESLSGEEFVERLSDILRRYVERRFHIQAPELTTEEFLDKLISKKNNTLEQHKLVLQRFLEYCDLVKFASKKTNDEEVQKGFDFLKDFIENTRERENIAA